MSLILESDKRIFHDLVQKIEDSAISKSESTELDALILKYLPSLKKAAEERLGTTIYLTNLAMFHLVISNFELFVGVHIKNIIFFCTQEERSTIKQLKTTKTKRNTVIIAAEDARRWFQLQGLLLRRILAASGETLDIDSGGSFSDSIFMSRTFTFDVDNISLDTGSLSSSNNPNILANGSILRSRWNSQGGAGHERWLRLMHC